MTATLQNTAGISTYFRSYHADLWAFLETGQPIQEWRSAQDLCDFIYTLHMLGDVPSLTDEQVVDFCRNLLREPLAGFDDRRPDSDPSRIARRPLSVHNTAYVLGAMNLLSAHHQAIIATQLSSLHFRPERTVDVTTGAPKFPAIWAHHSWRVSHWMGGAVAALISVARLDASSGNGPDAMTAQNAAREYVDSENGLLRMYGSQTVHRLLSRIYEVRHSARLGELGGVAHVLWNDHSLGLPYKAPRALLDASTEVTIKAPKFFEGTPYCLDFDILQIMRTALAQLGERPPAILTDRLAAFGRAIGEFLVDGSAGGSYGIHRLPGAIAAIHEISLILGSDPHGMVGATPRDIILDATWI